MTDAQPLKAPGTTVLVRTTEELKEAYETLSTTTGGKIQIAADAEDVSIIVLYGGSEHVTITSENPNDPVVVQQIGFGFAENVTVTHVDVSSAGVERANQWDQDLQIDASSHITVSNVNFSSVATELYDPSNPDVVVGRMMGEVDTCTDIVISDITVSGYFHGLSMVDSQRVVVEDSTFAKLQGDGIRLVHMDDIDLRNNTFRDFLGSEFAVNHDDMIQIWATRPGEESSNVRITDNILNSGTGVSTQSILVGNEALAAGLDGAVAHRNITISDNLIYNGHTYGVAAIGVDGLKISDNTMLWNKDSFGMTDGEFDNSSRPEIRTFASTNVIIINNVAAGVPSADGNALVRNNMIVNYDDPEAASYVATHFINPPVGSATDPTEIRFRPDSPIEGIGSNHTRALTQSEEGVIAKAVHSAEGHDAQTIRFDAGFSVDVAGFVDPDLYTFRWLMPDGSIHQGMVIDHTFDTPGVQAAELIILRDGVEQARGTHSVEVNDRDFLVLDFDSGIADLSSNDTKLISQTGAALVLVDGGLQIGPGQLLATTRSAEQYRSLESFGLEMDLDVSGTESGVFLRLGLSMIAAVRNDGSVYFALTTDEGSFALDSGSVSIHGEGAHRVSIGYSDAAGQLELWIDGVLAASTEASGVAVPPDGHAFWLGSLWEKTLTAVVDNVYFGSDPAAVGIALPDGVTPLPDTGGDVVVEPEPTPEVEPEPEPKPEPAPLPDPAKDLINLDFEGADWQGETIFGQVNADLVQSGFDGSGYKIGGHDRLVIDPRSTDLNALDSFGMSIDLELDNPNAQGVFLHMQGAFMVLLDRGGSLVFALETDTGQHVLAAPSVDIRDGGSHTISFGYSAEAGLMEMRINGETVGLGEASGTTAPVQHAGLAIGNRWWIGLEAEVDNFRFTETPEEVGIDLDMAADIAAQAAMFSAASPDAFQFSETPGPVDLEEDMVLLLTAEPDADDPALPETNPDLSGIEDLLPGAEAWDNDLL